MAERDQTGRRRCVVVGCNPVLLDEDAAAAHREETGHRTAAWPVRSEAGKAKAEERNKTGYYRKYNRSRGQRSLLTQQDVTAGIVASYVYFDYDDDGDILEGWGGDAGDDDY